MPNLSPPPPSGNAGLDQWLVQLDANSKRATDWTPTLTCGAPGDLAITYSVRKGEFFRVGPLYVATWTILTSAFTYTTATGSVSITGLPVAANADSGYATVGSLQWGGITLANYTQWTPFVQASGSSIGVVGNGSGQTQQTLLITHMPSAGTVLLRGFIAYR